MEKNEPIWVESLMTEKEYIECSKKYKTYCPSCKKQASFEECDRWRYGMGKNLSDVEIKTINSRIDILKEIVKKIKNDKCSN